MVGDERQIITLVVIKGLFFMLSPTLSLASLCCNIFSFHDDAEI